MERINVPSTTLSSLWLKRHPGYDTNVAKQVIWLPFETIVTVVRCWRNYTMTPWLRHSWLSSVGGLPANDSQWSDSATVKWNSKLQHEALNWEQYCSPYKKKHGSNFFRLKTFTSQRIWTFIGECTSLARKWCSRKNAEQGHALADQVFNRRL